MPRKLTAKEKRPGPFIMKHEMVLASLAYRDLNCAARCLLEEFQRVYKPGRNGKLSISVKEARKLCNVAQNTAANAFVSLSEHGFIRLTSGSSYQSRLTREWQLTMQSYGEGAPSDDWKRWEPGKPVFQITNNSRTQYVVQGGAICGTRPPQNVVCPSVAENLSEAASQ